MKGYGSNQLKSVVVYLEFDKQLQSLTGISRTPIEVTEGTPFFMLLQAILDSYPLIILTHDLTHLGFSINGMRPNPQATLSAHDVVTLGIQSDAQTIGGLNGEYYN
ncbi:MAG TPA: hypothetical protein PLV45_00825 [bacterium]|nr:hypothetical protein [bacterium]